MNLKKLPTTTTVTEDSDSINIMLMEPRYKLIFSPYFFGKPNVPNPTDKDHYDPVAKGLMLQILGDKHDGSPVEVIAVCILPPEVIPPLIEKLKSISEQIEADNQ